MTSCYDTIILSSRPAMKFNLTKDQKKLILFTIILRLSVPFLILVWPLYGILICMLVDCIDYTIVMFGNIRVDKPKLHPTYQRVDKALDQYYYTFILVYFLCNYSPPLTSLAICLYAWRLTGFILFQITNNRQFLIFGPNFFENFALAILLRHTFSIDFTNTGILVIVVSAILIKIPQEILIHGTKLLYKWDISHAMVNMTRALFGLKPFPKDNSLI